MRRFLSRNFVFSLFGNINNFFVSVQNRRLGVPQHLLQVLCLQHRREPIERRAQRRRDLLQEVLWLSVW